MNLAISNALNIHSLVLTSLVHKLVVELLEHCYRHKNKLVIRSDLPVGGNAFRGEYTCGVKQADQKRAKANRASAFFSLISLSTHDELLGTTIGAKRSYLSCQSLTLFLQSARRHTAHSLWHSNKQRLQELAPLDHILLLHDTDQALLRQVALSFPLQLVESPLRKVVAL